MRAGVVRCGLFVAVFVCAFAVGVRAQAGQSGKVDVTGTWAFDVNTDAGSGTPTVTLKQDGEKLTGHYSSTNLGEADLTGTVKGKEINFQFNTELQGTSLLVTYSGTVESATSMSGKMSIAGAAGGTFTAKKK